ncbi:MAG: DUF2071 domain-containing protein [Acidobacteriota bacterium]
MPDQHHRHGVGQVRVPAHALRGSLIAIGYRSRRTSSSAPPAEFAGRYRPVGEPREAVAGTLEHFLTERYCLFTVDHSARVQRLDIHHPPWPLQGAEAEITVNTMADAAGIQLPDDAPLLHFARRQDTVAWAPTRVDGGKPGPGGRDPGPGTRDSGRRKLA